MYKSWLIRRPFLLKKNFIPTAARSKKQAFGLSKSWLIRSPKKGRTSGGLLISHGFFQAPNQLMKRFSPQNGRFGPKFWKTFEDPLQKQPGSLSAIRVPQKEQHFGKITSVTQKYGLSKVCQKFETIHGAHSAEKTTFSRYDTKKCSVPQKKSFSANFQDLHQKNRK